MAAWNPFRKHAPDELAMRQQLVDLVMNRLRDSRGIRAEDAICGAATIVAERCIDAAGELSLRDHTYPPGQRVFSSRVNELLCGDEAEVGIAEIPAESVYGMLRDRVNEDVYEKSLFPDLKSVFAGFAAGVGDPKLWGKVPVTVPPEHHPLIVPLQFGFETREKVDAIFESIGADKARCLKISVTALAALLNMIGRSLAPQVGLRLAFEMANGMAKTAPMTKTAFQEATKAK